MRIFGRRKIPVRVRLIEWVLIFLILGIGALVFLPVFSNQRRLYFSSCLTNIKYVETCVFIYGRDNNDVFPPYYTFDGPRETQLFIDVTKPYVKDAKAFLCHSDNDPKKVGPEGLPGKMSYVHCLVLKGVIPEFSKGNRSLSESDFSELDASKIPYLRDPIRGFGKSENSNAVLGNPGFLSPHGGSFAIGFLDGHAKFKGSINEFTEL